MSRDTIRVVDRDGRTLNERPADRRRLPEAIREASKVGGKVFRIDRCGFLERVWPER